MARGISQPGQIHLRIIEVMKRFPEGISGGQIRHELEKEGLRAAELRNLHRRLTELNKWFIIEKSAIAQGDIRKMLHTRKKELASQILRAHVLYAACGRCQRCGKTIRADSITLLVEPKNKKGRIDIDQREDYWAVCEECSTGDRAHRIRPTTTVARPRFNCSRLSPIETCKQRKL
jgi:hypothetical protein